MKNSNSNKKSYWAISNINIASGQLEQISSELKLPEKIKNDAMNLYKRYIKLKNLSGRTIGSMIAACLFYNCKLNNIPIKMDDFTEVKLLKGNNKKKIYNCYSSLLKELDLKPPQISPFSFLAKLIDNLELMSDFKDKGVKFIDKLKEKGMVSGKDPEVLAAAVLYLVIPKKFNITQKKIAQVAKITKVGLNKRIKDIEKEI